MSVNIIKAWKDADYRNSLSTAELALVPVNPSGLIELNDEDLMGVTGAGSKKKGSHKKSGGGSHKGSGGGSHHGSGGGSHHGSGGGNGSGGHGGGSSTMAMCTCFWCK